MLSGWYGRWMTAWETDLTTRDTNRIVRPLEWGFDWLEDFAGSDPAQSQQFLRRAERNARAGGAALLTQEVASRDLDRMVELNQQIVSRSSEFYGYAEIG